MISVAVAVIVVVWLVHFVLGIRRTKRAYEEIMKKKAGSEEKTEVELPAQAGETINTTEDRTETEQKGNEDTDDQD